MQNRNSAAEPPRLRADARRNREQIVLAARDMFADYGPDVPLEDIAQRAGVGIGTLYRRFPDRAALQRAVALDVLGHVAHAARQALAEQPTAFAALAQYMHHALDLRIGAVMPMLAGQLPADDAELRRARDAASTPMQAMIERAQAEGALRPDVAFADIGLLIVRLAHPLPGGLTQELDQRLAHRHLDLLLDGLRMIEGRAPTPLPGPAMTLPDLRAISSEHVPSAEQSG